MLLREICNLLIFMPWPWATMWQLRVSDWQVEQLTSWVSLSLRCCYYLLVHSINHAKIWRALWGPRRGKEGCGCQWVWQRIGKKKEKKNPNYFEIQVFKWCRFQATANLFRTGCPSKYKLMRRPSDAEKCQEETSNFFDFSQLLSVSINNQKMIAHCNSNLKALAV